MGNLAGVLISTAVFGGMPAWFLYQSYNGAVAGAFLSITVLLLAVFWEIGDLRKRVEGEIRVAERKREHDLSRNIG